jgi:hypothetical protein
MHLSVGIRRSLIALLVSCHPVFSAEVVPAIAWAEIPGGTFVMGSPASVVRVEDEAQHQVSVSAFEMATYHGDRGPVQGLHSRHRLHHGHRYECRGHARKRHRHRCEMADPGGVNWECDVTGREPRRSAPSPPMPGGCSICTATSGSGAQTDMKYRNTTATDPRGSPSRTLRVECDGGWFHGANDCLSARRGDGEPIRNRNCDVGFRVVRDVDRIAKGPLGNAP